MPDTPMSERNIQYFPMQSVQIDTDELGNPIYDNAADAELIQAFRGVEISDGIYPGDDTYLQVISNGDMSITIKAGKAHIQGVQVLVKEDVILTAEDADPLVDRTDRVVLRLDLVNREVLLDIKEGYTALTRTAGTMWELGLADLAVTHLDSVIASGDITDLRSDVSICGIVSGLIEISVEDPRIDTGWIPSTATWTYFSVDDPIGVVTVNENLADKISIGYRIKFKNNGNTIYGIVVKDPVYSAPDTTITFLHEIDPTDSLALTLLQNSAITSPCYSPYKVPLGFLSTPD